MALIICPGCGSSGEWMHTIDTTATAELIDHPDGSITRHAPYDLDDPSNKPEGWFWCGVCGETADDDIANDLDARYQP